MFQQISSETLWKLISSVFLPLVWPMCPEPLGVKTVCSLISSPYVEGCVCVSVCLHSRTTLFSIIAPVFKNSEGAG